MEGEVRWVPRAANVHLTLKFLGAVDEGRLEEIAAALDAVRARHAPFNAETSGFGAFPSPRRARVLWAGIGAGAENLGALAADVEGSLEGLGFERETRPYAPHLTLGRARNRPVRLLPTVDTAEASEAASGRRFVVRGFGLVESRPVEDGVNYAEISAFPLRRG